MPRGSCCWINGRRCDGGSGISPYDRGFLYGDGVFEVFRVYRGHPFALGEHLRRLHDAAHILGFALQVGYVARCVEDALETLPDDEDQYVRVTLTRGEQMAGLLPGEGLKPTVVVSCRSISPVGVCDPPASVSACTFAHDRGFPYVRELKMLNYQSSIEALRMARARGAEDAILVTRSGEVLEGASSNIFVVVDGEGVRTPPSRLGLLAGITRERVLGLAKDLGLPAREQLVYPTDLYRAKEVFLTSSVREIVSVRRIDGRDVGDASVGPVATRLLRALRRQALAHRGGSF